MRSSLRTTLFLAPATAWLLCMLVLPLVVVIVFSFGERGAAGGYVPAFTFDNYANVGSRWGAFRNTLTLAPLGTVLCLLIAWPLAYFLALKADPRWRTLLLILVIVPFWTSILIRSYAWIQILGGNGLPSIIASLGLPRPRLINTPFAVMVGIVYGYLPLMVFPIYVALEKLDRRLLEASADLGSPPWRTFLQVTLPLSMSGVATGSMLVFILLIGEFLIPQILGGGKVFFVGNALVDLFLQSRNWPFGAAVAAVLVIVMLIAVTLYLKAIKRVSGGRDDVALM